MSRYAVIVDVDNTLYNFVDYFAPAFRAMVHQIASKTRLPEEEIIRACRAVYAEAGNLEYPGVVQHLGQHIPELAKFDIDELRYLAHRAFSRSRIRRMRLYEDVLATIDWMRSHQYLVIAYTDGPYTYNLPKIVALGLKKRLDGLVAWVPSSTDLPRDGRLNEELPLKWFVQGRNGPPPESHILVPLSDKKPSTKTLGMIMEHFELDHDNTWVVGDSIEKDIAPALQLGLKAVWARYGKVYDAKNWDTLVQVTPWRPSVVASEQQNASSISPSFTIDSFQQLMSILPSADLFAGAPTVQHL